MKYFIPLMIGIMIIDLAGLYYSWYWKISGTYHPDEYWKSTFGLIAFSIHFGIISLIIIRRIRRKAVSPNTSGTVQKQ